jgi:outer membrane lipoprotein carrier protein
MLHLLEALIPCLVLLAAPDPGPATGATPRGKPAAAASAKPSAKPAASAKHAAPATTPAEQLAAKVQSFYEKTRDFSADFVQVYLRVALSKTSESRGSVKVLKPGMMRWDYVKPEPKHFIADGKQLFVYDPEDQHVSIDPAFQLSDQGSSLSFLWGTGKLADEFTIKLGAAGDLAAPAGTEALVLVPKRDASYKQLVLMVEPATGKVVESILFETAGNTNRFRFTNVKTNVGLEAANFQFVPPPGAEVAIIKR